MYVSADFYTNVYGLKPEVAAVMFLIVRIVDVLWDPLVGAFVDKHNPKLGKYRSYLIWGGIPLTGFAILCFGTAFRVHCSMPISLTLDYPCVIH